MASVTVMTADAVQAIMDGVIVGATINGSGHLILTKNDSSTIDAGAVLGSVPSASTTVSGTIKTADNGTTSTGTDTGTAVTPAGLASVLSTISTAITNCQPKDSDLTAIAALTPAANDALQYKSGAWANRTMAQLLTDLSSVLSALAALTPSANDILQYKSGAWANRTPTQVLVDLGAVGAGAVFQYNGTTYAAVNTPGIYSGSADPGSVANGSVWYTTT